MRRKRTKHEAYASIIFPACLGIGTAIGALIHNIGVGLFIGTVVGAFFNLIGYYLLKSGSDEESLPHS